MCGASAGGGGISAAGGYNAYKVIADDYNLPKLWQQERSALLERSGAGGISMPEIYTTRLVRGAEEAPERKSRSGEERTARNLPRAGEDHRRRRHRCICRLAKCAISSSVFADGKCLEYRQVEISPPRKDFDFIFELPASVFEGVAAGLIDLIDAGLKGKIKIIGDMRILIRHAELVNAVYDVYAREIETTWPKGKPIAVATTAAAAAR